MPKPKKQSPVQPPLSPDPAESETGTDTDLLTEPDNGHPEMETSERSEFPEEPAQVELKIKGSDKSARAAAKRFGGDTAKPPPVTTPANDVIPPDDTDALLADGHNMVVVRRTFPKTVEMDDHSNRRCAIKLPDRYECPTSREKIENDVFERYGGSEYKCTIHPATTNGETNAPLGFFTIEHPNPSEPPYFPDDPPREPEYDPRTDPNTRGSDSTMHETDGLSKLRADAERRVERARILKETRQLELEAKRLEDEIEGTIRQPVAPVGESEEVKKLREENERLRREAEAKKTDDRFAAMQGSIADLAKSVTTLVSGGGAKAAAAGEESILLKMLTQSQQHAKDMIELVKEKRPVAPSDGVDFDKMLDRMTKLQAITGTGQSKPGTRLSELENRLIDMSFERLIGGGEGGGEGGDGDTEDVAKLAVKEFAPILKTFVEKKMEQENAASGGAPLTQEKRQQVYAEAAQAAAKKVTEDLAVQGIYLSQSPDGRLIALQAKPGAKGVVPPRATTKVVSEHRTSGGVVKKISIEPANLSGKPNVAQESHVSPAAEPKKETEMPKRGEFPMLGEGGATIYIDFPQRPGDIKYDRKYSVNFVLDGIRSEIRQGLPQKAEKDRSVESYAVADAIQYLDDEILDLIFAVDSGAQLEALLAPWGEAAKIAEIKKAGEDETVSSYLRKLVLSIQREWQAEKNATPQS